MSAALAAALAWLEREHARLRALDALSDMGVDVEKVRRVRRLVELGLLSERSER